jgi:CxxC motif-containing protein
MEEKTKRNIICISCPRGCDIQTSLDGNGAIVKIEGNFCKLGEDYVAAEIREPKRIVTSTVRIKNGEYPLIPVWTVKPIPKDRIFELMELIREIELEAPVKKGHPVLKNIFGLNIDVVASKSIKKRASMPSRTKHLS